MYTLPFLIYLIRCYQHIIMYITISPIVYISYCNSLDRCNNPHLCALLDGCYCVCNVHCVMYRYIYYSRRKNNRQKIQPAHPIITKRVFTSRGSCFCEKYRVVKYIAIMCALLYMHVILCSRHVPKSHDLYIQVFPSLVLSI